MIRRPIPRWLTFALGISSIILLAGCYELLSLYQTRINPSQTVVPNFQSLGTGIQKILQPQGSPEQPRPSWLWEDICATYYRLFLAMACGVTASVVVGMLMGAYTPVAAFFSPIITFMSKVPPTAMLVVYMVPFGTKLSFFVALVAFGIFFTMVQGIAQAVETDVDTEHIDKAYTLGASEGEVLIEVVWRQILPRIIDSIRLHIGPAMIFLVAAEALFGSNGFGYRIKIHSRFSSMNVVFPYIAFLGASGLLMDWTFLGLRRWLCPWFGDKRS
jgi:NitT/TauT family transport system permease protein